MSSHDETTLARMDLYRFFDADDQLLYIGISLHAAQRASSHRRDKAWWPLVRNMTVESLGDIDRGAAQAIERAAIIRERPMHNIVHHPGMVAMLQTSGEPSPWACVTCGRKVNTGYVVVHDFQSHRRTPKCDLRRCSGHEGPLPSMPAMVEKEAVDPCLAVWRPCYGAIWDEAMAYFSAVIEDTEAWHCEHMTDRCAGERSSRDFVFDVRDARLMLAGRPLPERFPLLPNRPLAADEVLPSDPSSLHLLPWPPMVDLSGAEP